MISSISLFGILIVVVCCTKYDGLSKSIILLWIHASPADAAAVNPNGMKMLLANGLSTSFINDKQILSNESRCLVRNLLDCSISDIWVFDDLILANKSLANALQSLQTCLSVSDNLSGILVSSLDSWMIFNDSIKFSQV